MNILILEPDIQCFDSLCAMLDKLLGGCNIIGPIANVEQGQTFFAENRERLDIIIAEVQLDDGLSFYALDHAPSDVPVVFTTSHGEHALQAFAYNSLSYLLKPITEDALNEALHKARERLITDEHREELLKLVARKARYRERFRVRTFNGERVVSVSKMRYIVSEQKVTYLVLADGSSYELNKPLTALQEELDPRFFMRVNRKYIVPSREVEGFEYGTNGKERMILKGDNPPLIIISRENKDNVHKWLS